MEFGKKLHSLVGHFRLNFSINSLSIEGFHAQNMMVVGPIMAQKKGIGNRCII